MLMMMMMFKMLTSMRLDYLHRSSVTNTLAWNLTLSEQPQHGKPRLTFPGDQKEFEPRPRTEAYQRMGRKPFWMRWIDTNKVNGQRPELRSRLVVQQTRQTSTISVSDIAAVTSSTPPLEVVRLFCSLMMSMKCAGGEPLVLQFLDVSRAYPHAEGLRDDFYVETVSKMGLPEDTYLLARRGWYGMRDAGQAFEFAVCDHFLDHDFKQGMFSTCVFGHRSKCTGMITSGLECVATWKVIGQICLKGSSSRIEESWVPTACMRCTF